MRLTRAQLERLRQEYATVRKITTEDFDRLKATVGRLASDALTQLADSGIAFVDTAANSVLVDRGIRGADARLDHAINKVLASRRVGAVA